MQKVPLRFCALAVFVALYGLAIYATWYPAMAGQALI
jgi:hypothetical protein